MADTMKESLLQQEVDNLQRELSYAYTTMRNAIVEIEENNYDGARATLKDVVG